MHQAGYLASQHVSWLGAASSITYGAEWRDEKARVSHSHMSKAYAWPPAYLTLYCYRSSPEGEPSLLSARPVLTSEASEGRPTLAFLAMGLP